MTAALERAFVKASRLPAPAQDQLAEQVLDDIAGELKWDKTLADSQDVLEAMAARARTAKRRRKAVKKGFDEL
jgi:hypothetical protein